MKRIDKMNWETDKRERYRCMVDYEGTGKELRGRRLGMGEANTSIRPIC